ncbi:MAG: exonuclease domain-containing protein [candidate division Zixibacteria bacterium]|nr:exonuclease domain-containing protein [candidate division Zixibacteria bacterium]
MKSQVFVAFDTETTGLWAYSHRILELGAVKFRLDTAGIESFESLINPERSIPAEVIPIHGITDKMVIDAPSAPGVLNYFLEFCDRDSILIAHNASFDISFLACEFERAELDFSTNPVIDTVDIYHHLFPGLDSYSLLSLVKHFQISTEQDHRALSDAKLVYLLFSKAAKKLAHIENKEQLLDMISVYRMTDWHGNSMQFPPEFAELEKAINKNMRVEINYDTSAQTPTVRIIHPRTSYALGSNYYINAFCERAGGERTFRLDRIKSFRILKP